MLSVGIDFGTTNSSVAVYDGESVRLLPIDPGSRNPFVMRSLIYINREGSISYGEKALNLYLEQNTGRSVRYEMRKVGTIEMVFAEVGTMVKDAYGLIDVNEPGRLFQSLKRFLTSTIGIGAKGPTTTLIQEADSATSFQVTNVFGMDFRIEELLSLLAKEIVRATEAALGEPVTRLTVGWPVRFSEEAEAEELARTRLREAWHLATDAEISFVEEPVAAIQHYAHRAELGKHAHVLVFDFGGGTLDVSVSRLEEGKVTALATNGVPMGGDLIDSRLVETRLAPLFGEEAKYKRTGLPLPRHLFRRLQSWQTLNELNKPEYVELMDRARFECDQPEKIAKLETLVKRNYGLAFFQSVERAKVLLSDAAAAEVRLDAPGLDIAETISRDEFESAVSPQVRRAEDCTLEAVSMAKLTPEDIDLVVTTGGSSQIPAFQRMLRAAFPKAEFEASDAFTSVAAGLAVYGS